MPEQDGEVFLQGNLFPRQIGTPMFQQAIGYDAFLRLEVSSKAIVVETGISGLTASEASMLNLIPALL